MGIAKRKIREIVFNGNQFTIIQGLLSEREKDILRYERYFIGRFFPGPIFKEDYGIFDRKLNDIPVKCSYFIVSNRKYSRQFIALINSKVYKQLYDLPEHSKIKVRWNSRYINKVPIAEKIIVLEIYDNNIHR